VKRRWRWRDRPAATVGLRPLSTNFRSRFPRKKILVSDVSCLDPASVRELISRDAAAVLCTSDRWLLYFTRHWDDLGVADWLHPAPAVVDVLLDKIKFSRWCAGRNINSPRLYTAEMAANGQVPFPVVVRPNKRRLSNRLADIPKMRHVLCSEELFAALELYRRMHVDVVLTESLLTRELIQYSVPFVRKNGKTLLYVAEKVRPVATRCEIGTYVRTVRNETAIRLVQSMIEGLEYEGIGEAELLYDVERESHYVVEINARPWTQFQMSVDAGYDFLRYYFDQAAPSRAKEAAWLDFSGDARVVLSPRSGMLSRHELSFLQYVDNVRKATSYSVWDISDPLPAVYDAVKNIKKLFST
jgi:predicted ATP-grasp superfamily ATP-dependent carboligase